MSKIPEPLRAILFDYCHIEWGDEVNELPLDVIRDDWAYDAALFKSQLSESISKPVFSPDEFEAATGEAFDSEEELQARLRAIWDIAFPGEEP
jgi:hypothetical protein